MKFFFEVQINFSSCQCCYFLKEKIRAKDFVGAKWDLISMLASKAHEKLDAEEQRSFYQILITGGLSFHHKVWKLGT